MVDASCWKILEFIFFFIVVKGNLLFFLLVMRTRGNKVFNSRLMSGIHVRLRRLSSLQLKVHDKVHPVEFSRLKSQKDIFRSPSEALDLKKKEKGKSTCLHKAIF